MPGRVVFNMSVSLDLRVATPDGSLDWLIVDAEVHRLFNDEARSTSAFLMGRRTYELLQAHWPTADQDPAAPDFIVDFAGIWRTKPKFVFSRSLEVLDDPTATVLREVTRDSIEGIKGGADGALSVGGANLAASFAELGLIDDYVVYVNPVVLGGGPKYFAPLERPQKLRLTAASALASGVVRLAYSTL